MTRTLLVMLGILGLVAGLAACGDEATGSPPVLSNLQLSSTTVAPGGTISGTMNISDPDGLGGMSVSLTITGPATAQSTVPVQNATDALKEASVPFVVQLGAAPAGSYTVSVTATDGDGNSSNTLTTQVTVQ